MEKEFVLCQGISVKNAEGMKSSYNEDQDGVRGVVSCHIMAQLANDFIDQIDEPVFFFLELPKNLDDEEYGYDVYYLDNCTAEVAKAVVLRYGELLVNDGMSRFGFGSHKTNEEIYFEDYQEFMIYSTNTAKIAKLMENHGIEKVKKTMSMWDFFSEENPGMRTVVEINDETVYDIYDNLKSVGMYKAD